jgi:signal transduction histidine kinase
VRALRRVDPRALDWALALLFAVWATITAYTSDHLVGPAWLTALIAGGSSGAAAYMRRARPLAAITSWSAGVIVLAAWLTPPEEIGGLFFGLLLFPYIVGANVAGAKALIGPPVVVVTVTAVALTSVDGYVTGDIIFPTIFGLLMWLAGRVVRSRAELTAELHEAALVAHEQREADAARAVAEERRRIAREMHDVVAHSVSMMVVQAGGARRILDRDPARAVAAAELIEQTGREALAEMRRLLGVLHPGEHAEYAPQPTLRELDALVERTRVAGVPVTLAVDGERRELPAGLDLAAYRVVQEALTNVVKHGGGAPTEVHVHYRDDAVEVRIADRGNGALDVRLGGSGQGLVGMRERVRMYGGELHAGRRRGGGFEVSVRLQMEGEDDAALTAGARA